MPAAGRIFFLVHGATAGIATGDALWVTDGTAAGARLFLAVFHPATGEELGTSDGTAGGTRRVADLNPGPASAAPQELAAVDGKLVFAADDGTAGLEPWVSDGTAAGTFRLADVAAGADASSPSGFTAVGERLYFAAADREHGRELWSLPRAALTGSACRPDDTTLCLGSGRFGVTVRWTSPNAPGGSGPGHAVPFSEETGRFWFFDAADVELLVKILDGGAINQRIWYFSGALSDVAYDVTVTDYASGASRVYRNPAGTNCGQADTAAFPATPGGKAAVLPPASVAQLAPVAPTTSPASPAPAPFAASPCPSSPFSLCLLGGRFEVQAYYIGPGAHDPAPATAVPATDRSGYFWFFGPGNLELAVKLLDGRALNGHFWVFAGALTDVNHALMVFDHETGALRSYPSPQGQLCGSADVEAF